MDKEEYKAYYLSVYRHSLAHILAKAVIEIFGKDKVQYAIGPQIADGFYYDFILPRPITEADYPWSPAAGRSASSSSVSTVLISIIFACFTALVTAALHSSNRALSSSLIPSLLFSGRS